MKLETLFEEPEYEIKKLFKRLNASLKDYFVNINDQQEGLALSTEGRDNEISGWLEYENGVLFKISIVDANKQGTFNITVRDEWNRLKDSETEVNPDDIQKIILSAMKK